MSQRVSNGLRNVAVLVGATLVVLVAVWLVRGLPGASTESSTSAVEIEDAGTPAPGEGEAAPGFSGRTLAGEEVAVREERDRPLWIIFNATWCANCRAEMPDIQEMQDRYGDQVQIVAVYLNDSPSAVLEYSHQLGLTFGQLPDPDGKIGALYRSLGVPMHYFIGSDGTIEAIAVGALSPANMEEHLHQLLP